MLSVYFAALLMAAGFTKLDNPGYFSAALRAIRLLPPWSVPLASAVIPWAEILFAFLLISGLFQIVVATVNLALFIFFLMIKLTALRHKLPTGCGCFGLSLRQQIDPATIIVSLVFIVLATMYLWLVSWTTPVSIIVRLIALLSFLVFSGAILLRVIHRHLPKSLLYGEVQPIHK